MKTSRQTVWGFVHDRAIPALLAATLLALNLFTLSRMRAALGSNWVSNVEVANGLSFMNLVVACFFGAWRWRPYAGPVRDLWASAPRSKGWPLRVLGPLMLVSIVVQVVWFVGVLVAFKPVAGGGLNVAPLAAVVVYTWAGLVVGAAAVSLTPARVMPVVAAVGAYAACLALTRSTFKTSVALGGMNLPLTGVRVNPTILLAQISAGVGLALLGYAVLTWRAGTASYALPVLAPLLISCLLLGTAFAQFTPAVKFVPDATINYTCQQIGRTELCVLPETSPTPPPLATTIGRVDAQWRRVTGERGELRLRQTADLDLPFPVGVVPISLAGDESPRNTTFSYLIARSGCGDEVSGDFLDSTYDVAVDLTDPGTSETARQQHLDAWIKTHDCG